MSWILRLLTRKTGFLPLIPHPTALGTATQEVYFGLLAARRRGKRLLVLQPVRLPWPFHLPLIPWELLDLESPFLACSPHDQRLYLVRLAMTAYFAMVRFFGRIARRVGATAVVESEVGIPTGGQELLWVGAKEPPTFDWSDVFELDWERQYSAPLHVSTSPATRTAGQSVLSTLGIGKDDWWVCLHVREPGFYGDTANSTYRNADIQDYADAIVTITSLGGWVFRLGDRTMQAVIPGERVVDLAHHTDFNTPRINMFLIEHCRAYIGMQSGPLEVALLFDKPRLILNMYSWVLGCPFRESDWGAFQHLSNGAGHALSLHQVMMSAKGLTSDWGISEVEYRRLSSDEMRQVTADFMAWVMDGCPARPMTADSLELFERFKTLLQTRTFRDNSRYDKLTKFRLAAMSSRRSYDLWVPRPGAVGAG